MCRTLLSLLPFACLSMAALAAPGDELSVRSSARPPEAGINDFYPANRAPLIPSPLIKLPLGAVRAQGWLRRQLELTAQGFTGRLPEISRFCRFQDNAWADPNGQGPHGWEELPYWLRGFYPLGVLLDDPRIQAEARRWLEAALATQRPDGYFGPRSNLEGGIISAPAAHGWPFLMQGKVPDLWPHMVMLYPLRSWYEATGDQRILDFMLRYFRWQTEIPLHLFVPVSWQHWRAADNLDSIHWLYNQTGERFLLDLARVNHERTADWVGGVPTWHVVNIAQCFRGPAQFYQQTADVRYLRATERVYDTVRAIYGQVPGGMYGADENARPGFTGPRQGTETCAMAEIMYSHQLLARITGDPLWADRCEEVAFNSLPPSMTPDLRGLHYLTAPNQVRLDRADKWPMIDNRGDMFSYNPHQYRCCQHNVAFAWPYFTEHLWMATRQNGLAAVLYAPATVRARVGDGVLVTITQKTAYPFDETVTLSIATPKPVRFPLTLRVPGWCRQPRLSLNGMPVTIKDPPRGWLTLERTWRQADTVQLELPQTVAVTLWTRNRNTVSVHRGPLTYSLRIGERWERSGGTDQWPGFEVFPTTPWNYGLILDLKNPAASFQIERKSGELAAQPFTLEAAPIMLRARGRRIPEWELEPNGMIGEVQPGPVRSAEPVEQITLIPMGAARLRISAFPQIGEGPDARPWKQSVPIPLASYSTVEDPPTAVNDDLLPAGSADLSIPRFSWGGRRGTREWLELWFSRPERLSSLEVYWAEDQEGRGPCRLPESWRLTFWDGGRWQPVRGVNAYEIRKDSFSRAAFEPLTTTRLRLLVELQEGRGAGILELRLP